MKIENFDQEGINILTGQKFLILIHPPYFTPDELIISIDEAIDVFGDDFCRVAFKSEYRNIKIEKIIS